MIPVTCIAIMPGCTDCAEQVRDHDECDDLCSFSGEQRRASESYHRLIHEPIRCAGCGAVLDDRKGNDRMVTKLCPKGYCRLWCCPDCGEEWASNGPVGCPSCSPISWWGRLTIAAYGWWLRLRERWLSRPSTDTEETP